MKKHRQIGYGITDIRRAMSCELEHYLTSPSMRGIRIVFDKHLYPFLFRELEGSVWEQVIKYRGMDYDFS